MDGGSSLTTMDGDAAFQPPLSADTLASSANLPLIPRFHHLLSHAQSLAQHYGPYALHANTTVLTRSTSSTTNRLSTKPLAISLAAAQDAHTTAQPDGPAKHDLALFTALAQTSVAVLEHILEAGIPDGEAFGWGVYGLTWGYLPAMGDRSSSASSRDSVYFDDEFFDPAQISADLQAEQRPGTRSPPTFGDLQRRLRAALDALPSLSIGTARRESVAPAERIGQLIRKRNEVHLCATLLVQRFRGDEWRGVRWGHLVAVTERWLAHLALSGGG